MDSHIFSGGRLRSIRVRTGRPRSRLECGHEVRALSQKLNQAPYRLLDAAPNLCPRSAPTGRNLSLHPEDGVRRCTPSGASFLYSENLHGRLASGQRRRFLFRSRRFSLSGQPVCRWVFVGRLFLRHRLRSGNEARLLLHQACACPVQLGDFCSFAWADRSLRASIVFIRPS